MWLPDRLGIIVGLGVPIVMVEVYNVISQYIPRALLVLK